MPVIKKLHTKLINNDIVNGTVELLNQTIEFDGASSGLINIKDVFKTSSNYVDMEIDWYKSQHTKVDAISNHAKMWGMVSDENNVANSNYGYLIFSPQNGYQYKNVLVELQRDTNSRRAVMNYTNPFIHYTGGKDYICTQYVSYMIRDGKLHCVVSMRSSDVRFGIIGADLAWQIYVINKLADDLGIEVGKVNWHASSLHIYERHFEQLKEICK